MTLSQATETPVPRNDFLFIHGITLIAQTPLGCRSLGIRPEQLEEAAGPAARSAGWQIEESSPLVIAITIDSLDRRNDRLALKAEVRGGISSESMVGERTGIGSVLMSRSFDAGPEDSSVILRVTSELVSNVAQKLRREYLRLSMPAQPNTVIDNNELQRQE
jgi:hypothetical protein